MINASYNLQEHDINIAAANFMGSKRSRVLHYVNNSFAVNEITKAQYDMMKIRANAENDLILAKYTADRRKKI